MKKVYQIIIRQELAWRKKFLAKLSFRKSAEIRNPKSPHVLSRQKVVGLILIETEKKITILANLVCRFFFFFFFFLFFFFFFFFFFFVFFFCIDRCALLIATSFSNSDKRNSQETLKWGMTLTSIGDLETLNWKV